ncbi:hypothetical protein B0H66DRAFT_286739 [Apodospora peruviana]|uniref:Uncharacterized protein n=1 Tax=Apodospora peruviana TaxID=516989 RepID=A0AAE0M245_9PEZI|nr:hypothetical protein B0H66DRAFT_286739 [Apodospora peruviana]
MRQCQVVAVRDRVLQLTAAGVGQVCCWTVQPGLAWRSSGFLLLGALLVFRAGGPPKAKSRQHSRVNPNHHHHFTQNKLPSPRLRISLCLDRGLLEGDCVVIDNPDGRSHHLRPPSDALRVLNSPGKTRAGATRFGCRARSRWESSRPDPSLHLPPSPTTSNLSVPLSTAGRHQPPAQHLTAVAC